jgi:hypothetical protein
MTVMATGPAVWRGMDLASDPSWIWRLPASAIAEIEAALSTVTRRGLKFQEIGLDDFALPSVSAELRRLSDVVERGRGFQVLRGVPVEGYSEPELRAICWGIGLHFGEPVEQTKDQDLLIDVRDEGGSYGLNARGYHSPAKLDFHTDGANVVALLCVNKAEHGGLSVLVSAGAVHNALAASHPEHLKPLYDGFPVDRRGAQPEGEARVSPWLIPVFSITRGQLNCVYSRGASVWGREQSGEPMTAVELAALDAFDALTHDAELRLEMDLQPGDMQLVNNFTILHSRTAFVDNPASPRRRHLIRLWLDNKDSDHAAINKIHLYTRTPLPTLMPIRMRR